MSSSKAPAAPKTKRRQQFAQTYRMAKKGDPRLGLVLLAVFVVATAVALGLLWLVPGPIWLDVPLALLIGVLATLIVFGRRAQRSVYAQMEGQPGAAAAALQMLRRGWVTEPAVGFTKQQDVVHRVVGPPGVVLIGEGQGARVRTLLANERRRHERVLGEGIPVQEIVCGRGEGEVPLPKLVRHLTKKKRAVQPAQMTDVLSRLKAVDSKGKIPLPKGPVPTNMKGMRQNMRGR